MTNAIRYSPRGRSTIYITIENGPDENYIIGVKDCGIGIPKESQKYIFQKFYRADNAVAVASDGSGIGLYVTRLIVEASGGKVWFSSDGIDKGSTFYFSIPYRGSQKNKGVGGLVD